MNSFKKVSQFSCYSHFFRVREYDALRYLPTQCTIDDTVLWRLQIYAGWLAPEHRCAGVKRSDLRVKHVTIHDHSFTSLMICAFLVAKLQESLTHDNQAT